MNYQVLKTEIETDPETLGYAGKSDQEIADLLNDPTKRTRKKPVNSAELLAWAGGNSRFMKLKRASENESLPDSVRSICYAALLLVQRDGTSFDPNLPDRSAMLDALVSSAVLTSEDKDALIALSVSTISRAEELGFEQVGDGHVKSAKEM